MTVSPSPRAPTGFTREQTRELLRRQKINEAAIDRALAREFGADPNCDLDSPRATVEFPVRIVLPWTALVSDNRKYSPASANGSKGGRMILRPEYRDAKAKARSIAREVVGAVLPVAFPLRLIARVYVPNARPGHDVANFAKCCHDALETVVYTNDEWLHRIVWERAGVDPDRPRCEIDITKF